MQRIHQIVNIKFNDLIKKTRHYTTNQFILNAPMSLYRALSRWYLVKIDKPF